jgi:hypothetical protein
MAPKIAGIKDLQEENDDEKRQAYYAGGQGQNGGGSGQEVLDPREFMKRAQQEMGAQSVGQWQDGQPPPPSTSFTGAGYSLNGAQEEGTQAPKPPQEHTITFYKDGFTVDDGPLRKPTDSPEDEAFLSAVNQGRMPDEFAAADGQAEGDVHLIDKSGEAYTPPPVVLKPFSGEGRSMRDDAAGSSSGAAAAAPTEAQELSLDPNAPTTTLQVRLADGSRKVVKANHTHTVLQLRSHIATFLAPGASFTLKAGFPPKPLMDEGLTLADAKLLGDTILQSNA